MLQKEIYKACIMGLGKKRKATFQFLMPLSIKKSTLTL